MSSLWTPGGERPVNREPAEEQSGTGPLPGREPSAPPSRPRLDDAQVRAATEAAGLDYDSLSEEERAKAAAAVMEMAEAQQRIAVTPAAELVANHAVGLYELAAIKLSQPEADLSEARLVIDALAALIERVGDRLGDTAEPLGQALAQLQQGWVQRNAEEGDTEA